MFLFVRNPATLADTGHLVRKYYSGKDILFNQTHLWQVSAQYFTFAKIWTIILKYRFRSSTTFYAHQWPLLPYFHSVGVPAVRRKLFHILSEFCRIDCSVRFSLIEPKLWFFLSENVYKLIYFGLNWPRIFVINDLSLVPSYGDLWWSQAIFKRLLEHLDSFLRLRFLRAVS